MNSCLPTWQFSLCLLQRYFRQAVVPCWRAGSKCQSCRFVSTNSAYYNYSCFLCYNHVFSKNVLVILLIWNGLLFMNCIIIIVAIFVHRSNNRSFRSQPPLSHTAPGSILFVRIFEILFVLETIFLESIYISMLQSCPPFLGSLNLICTVNFCLALQVGRSNGALLAWTWTSVGMSCLCLCLQ